MGDLELDGILGRLTRRDTTSGGISRRRFLQGMLVTGTVASMPNAFSLLAGAASPIGPSDGILVVILLAGGHDGLRMVAPLGEAAYAKLRPTIKLSPATALPLPGGMGLHPKLPKLKARFDAGKVAIVRGVGQLDDDLSHFSSMANWMAGTFTTDRTSGWLGRIADGWTGGADGLRSVAIGDGVPLTLVGRSAPATSIPTDAGSLIGADRSDLADASMFDALSAFGNLSTGRGQWADAIGQAEKRAMATAASIAPAYKPALPAGDLTTQLALAARLINLNLGVRILHVTYGSFDTHSDEIATHDDLMDQLDTGIDAFYKTLDPKWSDRVALMTQSEFGRRVEENDSGGTDHGTAGPMLVIGDHVKGGMLGSQPSLTNLDGNGDLKVPVDFLSVYAGIASGWLGADPTTILGGKVTPLTVFASAPGPVGPPPPPPDKRWLPFATPTALVEQQYHDFLNRAPDAGGTSYWVGRLLAGTSTIPGVIESFVNSAEFGTVVRPAARLYLAATNGALPNPSDLLLWAGKLRGGTTMAALATTITATPASVARYGGLSDAAFLDRAYRDVNGRAPDAGWLGLWTAVLAAKSQPRSEVIRQLSESSENVTRTKPQTDVIAVYVGMLRRAPDAGGYTYWVAQARAGASLQKLIAGFFGSTEYRSRFA